MTDGILFSAVGCGVFAASNAGVIYAAHLLVRRSFQEERASVRWAALGLTSIAFVLVITQALASVSLYTRSGVSMACLFLAGSSRWLWGQGRLGEELRPVRLWLEKVTESRGAVLLCAAAVTLLLALRRGLAQPPLFWDALTYHMFLAGRLVQSASLSHFQAPFAMDHYASFPVNGELLAAWLILPFGRDLLVGLMNFGLLALGAVAIHALCRELGVDWSYASLGSSLVCFSPFLFAYVTTQAVDILVFAALMCATLFGIRYLSGHRTRDTIMTFAAAGTAAGTKYTSLVLAGLWMAAVATKLLVCHKRQGARGRGAATLVAALVAAMALGGRQYAENWLRTGNPVYPLRLEIAGREVLRGSPYSEALAAETGVGSRRDDLAQILTLFSYYPTWRTPTSAGPKFLLLSLMAMGLLVVRGRDEARWRLLLLSGFSLASLAAFYASGEGFGAVARRFWPGSANRFLSPPLALLAVCAMATLTAVRERSAGLGQLLSAALAGFMLWDLMVANTAVPPAFPLQAGFLACLVAVLASFLAARRPFPSIRRVYLWAAAVPVCVLLTATLGKQRDQRRWSHFETSTDVAWIPREFVEGWRFCDQPEKPLRIAVTAGWEYRGQNWFFYPLMGRHLQNVVTYVSLEGSDRLSHEAGARPLTGGSLPVEWLEGLHRERVEIVFVQKPWPIEERWMRENPQAFRMVLDRDAFKVYEVVKEEGAPGRSAFRLRSPRCRPRSRLEQARARPF